MPLLIFHFDIGSPMTPCGMAGTDIADIIRPNPGVVILLFKVFQHIALMIHL